MFHPINIAGEIFNQTGNGVYTHSSVLVGGPANEIKIAAGRTNLKTGLTLASVTRRIDVETLEGSALVRRPLIANIQLTFPKNATLTQLDAALTEVDTFLTTVVLNRILLGEQ